MQNTILGITGTGLGMGIQQVDPILPLWKQMILIFTPMILGVLRDLWTSNPQRKAERQERRAARKAARQERKSQN